MSDAIFWGLTGALVFEAVELLQAIDRVKGLPFNKPGELRFLPYIVSVALRLFISVGVVSMVGSSADVDPYVFFVIGMCPLITLNIVGLAWVRRIPVIAKALTELARTPRDD